MTYKNISSYPANEHSFVSVIQSYPVGLTRVKNGWLINMVEFGRQRGNPMTYYVYTAAGVEPVPDHAIYVGSYVERNDDDTYDMIYRVFISRQPFKKPDENLTLTCAKSN